MSRQGNMPNFTITETGSEQELDEIRPHLVRVFEHGRDLFRFVNGTDGLDVSAASHSAQSV